MGNDDLRGTREDCMRLLFRQPPAVLRPNGRGCWPVRARMVKNVRGQARLVVLSVLCREPERWAGFVPTRYDVTWFYWSGLGPDADNVVASCKALLVAAVAFCELKRILEEEMTYGMD